MYIVYEHYIKFTINFITNNLFVIKMVSETVVPTLVLLHNNYKVFD